MKRLFIALLAVLTLSSCESMLEETVTQQDVVGTWNYYLTNGAFWGEITITKSGDCSVAELGMAHLKYEEEWEIQRHNGTFKVSGSKVTIDIPGWPTGTYKIRSSRNVSNRFLINPSKTIGGMADAVIQKDAINVIEFVGGSADW